MISEFTISPRVDLDDKFPIFRVAFFVLERHFQSQGYLRKATEGSRRILQSLFDCLLANDEGQLPLLLSCQWRAHDTG